MSTPVTRGTIRDRRGGMGAITVTCFDRLLVPLALGLAIALLRLDCCDGGLLQPALGESVPGQESSGLVHPEGAQFVPPVASSAARSEPREAEGQRLLATDGPRGPHERDGGLDLAGCIHRHRAPERAVMHSPSTVARTPVVARGDVQARLSIADLDHESDAALRVEPGQRGVLTLAGDGDRDRSERDPGIRRERLVMIGENGL